MCARRLHLTRATKNPVVDRRGKRYQQQPCAGTEMVRRSPKEMRRKYPVDTRFRIYAKLTDKEGSRVFRD
jgi:hypothetical protein